MKLLPLLTEKSLNEAKKGNYTFWVDMGMNKAQIKKAVEEIFGVNVSRVRTMNYKGRREKNFKGRIRRISPRKKAMVTVGEKEKIDLFETETKKKK